MKKNLVLLLAISLAVSNPIALTSVNAAQVKTIASVSIESLFPDPSLATHVAEKLQKRVSDTISESELASITELSINGVPIQSLEGIQHLPNLREITLVNNGLTELPEELSYAANLESLKIISNPITGIPDWFGEMSQITHILLSRTEITSLPDCFQYLENLVELKVMESPYITEIPEWIGELQNLEWLGTTGVQAAALPESIGNLSKLSVLLIIEGGLKALPDSIVNLTNLTRLDICVNEFTSIPGAIASLPKLKNLDLFGNSLTDLPQEIKTKILNNSLSTSYTSQSHENFTIEVNRSNYSYEDVLPNILVFRNQRINDHLGSIRIDNGNKVHRMSIRLLNALFIYDMDYISDYLFTNDQIQIEIFDEKDNLFYAYTLSFTN